MSSPATSPKGRTKVAVSRATPAAFRNRAVSPTRSPKTATSPTTAGKTPRGRKVVKKEKPAAEAASEPAPAPAGPAPPSPAAAAPAAAPASASPARHAPAAVAEVHQEGDSPVLVFTILGILGALVAYIVWETLQKKAAVDATAATVTPVDWTPVGLPQWTVSRDATGQELLAAAFEYAKALYQWSTVMDHWSKLSTTLRIYVEANAVFVVTAYMTVYITLQSLAIPGSASLSVLGGAIFGFWRAMLLVCICSSVGASFCYLLSKTLFSSFVSKRLGDRLVMWENEIKRNKETIFSYMLFLRVTPFFPNWFINLASPHVGVPLGVFFVATFIGVVPLSVIPILGGATIEKLKDWSEVSLMTKEWPYVNLQILGIVTASALVSLVPVFASQKRSSFA